MGAKWGVKDRWPKLDSPIDLSMNHHLESDLSKNRSHETNPKRDFNSGMATEISQRPVHSPKPGVVGGQRGVVGSSEL